MRVSAKHTLLATLFAALLLWSVCSTPVWAATGDMLLARAEDSVLGEVPAPPPPPPDADVPVTALTMNTPFITIKPGAKASLLVAITPSNTTNRTITWKSTNPSVVTVSRAGIIRGIKAGTANILATSLKGHIQATSVVTVGIPVSRVSLDRTSAALTKGKTLRLKASLLPKNASNRKLVWSSSKPTVASVTQGGTVTAKGAGKAVITVTTQDGAKTARCIVSIGPAATGITLNLRAFSLPPKQTMKLVATLVPAGAAANITWRSQNPRIASVSLGGVVTALASGQTTIIATVGGRYSARCTISVNCTLFKGRNRVTSGYRLPIRPTHNGVDVVGDDSPKVYATVSGTVRYARMVAPGAPGWGSTWEWGYFVWVASDDGTHHVYAHMAQQPLVREGGRVNAGQVIGLMGNTGYSFGRHTHYEVRLQDRRTTTNPAPYAGIQNAVGTY